MKKLFIQASCFLLLLASISSCSKKIEDDYINPDNSTTGYVGKLFTYMLMNDRIRPTYWDYATFVTGVTGKYSQFIGVTTKAQMYVPSIGYNLDRWNSYYTSGIVNQYREIQKNFNTLASTQQAEQIIYLQLAKVIYYDQTAQIVDLWGDIPFSEAGSLNSTNSLSYAKFDDASAIYDTIIGGLKKINTFLASATLSNATKTDLSKQDILLNGDLTKWRRYVNSLRLRLLMRISNVNESVAKTEVTAMLNDPATYPLVDANTNNILLNMNPSVTSFSSEGLQAGITDGATSDGPIATEYMLNTVMVANSDPRTDVFWNPGVDGYKGLSSTLTTTEQENLIAKGKLATIDSGTFVMNRNVPGVLVTAAEVSFLKAEAYERWSLGTAQTAYEAGIRQSISFYYSLNQAAVFSGYTKASVATPATASIDAYIAGSGIAYSGTTAVKLQKIGTQKWLNFFILQAGQAWAEVRRTGYPSLTFINDPSFSSALQPPVRLLYPTTEKSYNAANYAKVAAKDTRDTKIFWDVN
ncbi:MAG: SusD/RagB family nutrient-binding outer membrane lipoprotein [Bacteroidota bacterium]|nr:SusD/RagB family nutrient-binding outer membrane lipoprotein [Bacteroidota bacterium]